MNPDRFGCEFEFIVNDDQDDLVIQELESLYKFNYLVDAKNSKITADPKYSKVHYKL